MKDQKNSTKVTKPAAQPVKRVHSAEGWKRAHQKRRVANKNAKEEE